MDGGCTDLFAQADHQHFADAAFDHFSWVSEVIMLVAAADVVMPAAAAAVATAFARIKSRRVVLMPYSLFAILFLTHRQFGGKPAQR